MHFYRIPINKTEIGTTAAAMVNTTGDLILQKYALIKATTRKITVAATPLTTYL